MRAASTARLVVVACVAASLAAGALDVALSSPVVRGHGRFYCLFDDAMISMRYAENLALGRGLVWNVGERVEGFSNPAWVLVMAVARAALGKVAAVAAVHAAGVALAALSVWLLARIGRALAGGGARGDAAAAVSATLALTLYPMFMWSWTGMDTGPLTALLLACVARDLSHDDRDAADVPLALGLGLACLLRPDAPLFALAVLGFRAARHLRRGRRAAPMLAEALVAAAPPLAWQVFRVAYYGEWMPNTYHLKATGLSLAARLRAGGSFVLPMLAWSAPLLAAIGARRALAPRGERPPRPGRDAEAAVVFGLYAAYQLWVGGDAWRPFFRQTLPAAALLIPSAGAALVELSATRPRRAFAAGLSLALLGTSAVIFGPHLRSQGQRARACQAEVTRAIVVRTLATPDASVASFAAGILPYYAEVRALDPLGRTDPVIARAPARPVIAPGWRGFASLPGHNKYDLHRTLVALRPTVINLLSTAPPCAWGADDLFAWCRENYVLIGPRGAQLLFARGSPAVRWERLRAPAAPRR